jgi:transcriptional regulator with XRE-family HTH domain
MLRMAERKKPRRLDGDTFAARLRSARLASKIPATVVAKRIGVCRSLYYFFETGLRDPRSKTVCEMAKVLGTTVGALHGERAA